MASPHWDMSRRNFGFALGILFAISIHLPQPKALFVYMIAGAITALRFRTLEWKWPKAFIPLGIAVLGIALGSAVGAHTKAGISIAHLWRALALITQAGIIVRAAMALAATDPISPKQKLARDVLARRRETLAAVNGSKPLIEQFRNELAKQVALNAEVQAYLAGGGRVNTTEFHDLQERKRAQAEIVAAIQAEVKASTERTQAATKGLKQARAAWDRNKAA